MSNESGKFLGKPPEVDSAGLDTSPVDGSTLPRTNIEPFSAAASFANTVTGTKILQSPIPNEATGQPVFKVTGTQEAGKSPTDVPTRRLIISFPQDASPEAPSIFSQNPEAQLSQGVTGKKTSEIKVQGTGEQTDAPTTPTETSSPVVEHRAIDGVRFEVTKHTDVPPEIEKAALSAVVDIWQEEYPNDPTQMGIVFDSTIRAKDHEGNYIDIAGCYNPELDTIYFGLDEMRRQFPGEDIHKVSYVAGHEVMHRVQFHRGENPTPGSQMTDAEHRASRYEKEADEAGRRVLAKRFPLLYHTYYGIYGDRYPRI